MQRRRFLSTVVVGSGLVAGCVGGDSGSDQSPSSTERTSTDTPMATDTATATETATDTATETIGTTTPADTTTVEPTSPERQTPSERADTREPTRSPDSATPTTDASDPRTIDGDGSTTNSPPTSTVRSPECRRDDLEPISVPGSVSDGTTEGFRLTVSDSTPAVGDTITVSLENVSKESQETGTDGHVTIQRRIDGEWRSLLFVGPNFAYDAALAIHDPGEGFSWELTLTREGISPIQNAHVCREVTPGTYRFVYWGVGGDTNPGVEFEVGLAAGTTNRTADREPRTTIGATTTGTDETTGITGEIQRRVSLANADDVPDEHEIGIGVELLESTVTAEHTARLRVTTTNEGPMREFTIGTEGCSIFNRAKGASDPPGLHLHRPESAARFERAGDRWTRDTDTIAVADYGCGPTPYATDESVTTEYAVWDDPLEEGYMTPGTYRFEVTVGIYGSDDDLGGEPDASFPWRFDLLVGDPNT